MPIRNKPTRFSKSWLECLELHSAALDDLDKLVTKARESNEPVYYRCAVRAMIVSWESFYSVALHRMDCFLETYYDLATLPAELSKIPLDKCTSCFDVNLTEADVSFLHESRFDALNATRFKKAIKLLEKFYRSSIRFDFSTSDWRDIVSIFDYRHSFTHPRNKEDFLVKDVARRLNHGGLAAVSHLNHLMDLNYNCCDTLKDIISQTAQ